MDFCSPVFREGFGTEKFLAGNLLAGILWRDIPLADEGQVVVNRAHRRRTLPYGCCDTFCRSRPYIAHCEEPRVARLEGKWQAAECIPTTVEVLGPERKIGEHEALGVGRR